VEVAALQEISRSRSEPAIRVQRARILLAYRESLSFFAWGMPWGCTIRRSSAAWSERQSKARWQPSMTGHRPARRRRSPLKPRLGLKTWLAERRPAALRELWAAHGVLVENERVVPGWDAVSESVGALLKMLPPGPHVHPDHGRLSQPLCQPYALGAGDGGHRGRQTLSCRDCLQGGLFVADGFYPGILSGDWLDARRISRAAGLSSNRADHSDAVGRKIAQNYSNRGKDRYRRGAQDDHRTGPWSKQTRCPRLHRAETWQSPYRRAYP
jgi:hypothetical protein